MATTQFAIQPAGLPPTAPARLPSFIQWQSNGVNLGLADADTIDLVGTGFTVTAAGNVLTIEADAALQGWDSGNETGTWTFSGSDFTAEVA